MKIYDEARSCECGAEITVQEDKFLNGLCESCYEKQAAKNTQNTYNASLLGYDGFCDDCGNECEHCTCEPQATELVSRPAAIKTVQFEMGGKQYQTRSSWELLD